MRALRTEQWLVERPLNHKVLVSPLELHLGPAGAAVQALHRWGADIDRGANGTGETNCKHIGKLRVRGGKPLVLGGPGRSVRPHHRRGTRGPAPPRTHRAGAGGRPERSLPVGRGPGRRFASFRFSQYPSKQLWLPACPRRTLSRAQPAVGTGALREAARLEGRHGRLSARRLVSHR